MERQNANLGKTPSSTTISSMEETSTTMTIGEGVPFERIRRITGYLAGDVRFFNNAKRAEERDRVKHDTKKEGL